MNKNIFKSIGAVVIGFVSVAIFSIVTDFIVEGLGLLPSAAHPEVYTAWMLMVALTYRSVYTVLGGYITAKLAPQNPMKHVYVLMVLGLIGGVVGAIGGWNLGNHWYPVSIAITGPIFVLLGGLKFCNKGKMSAVCANQGKNKEDGKKCQSGCCESCLMPFSKDTGVRENEKYCSLCFKNGKLCYEGNDVKEFQKVCHENMRKNGIGPIKAWFFTKMIARAPRWKK